VPVIDLREISDDSFVVHFGSGRPGEINARTFGEALLHLTDALREINAEINPGYELDVLVEALGSGSFRARLRTLNAATGNLFSQQQLNNFIVGVLTTLFCMKVFDTSAPSPPIITVNVDAVVVQHGDTKVIVPREVYSATTRVEKKPRVSRAIADTIRVIDRDPEVTSFGITRRLDDPVPDLEIPRDLFQRLIDNAKAPEEEEREKFVEEDAQLTVRKAILERSTSKWEFYWNGIRISAPIKDQTFFDRLEKHEISLQHGDTFDVTLRIHKVRDPLTGAWVNKDYEVVEVRAQTGRAPRQARLD
jgi:hypothetical protein